MFKRKTDKKPPEIPTAALPDIIFILLFFFVITVTPEVEKHLVDATIPTEERLKESEPEHKIVFFIGKPINPNLGTQPVVQFFDEIIKLESIPAAISNYRANELDATQKNCKLTASIKCDYKLPYGFMEDFKAQLQKAGIQKLDNIIEVEKD